MKDKTSLKKLWSQIRLAQEKNHLKELDVIRLDKLDKMSDRLTRRIFIFWALFIATVYVCYQIFGIHL